MESRHSKADSAPVKSTKLPTEMQSQISEVFNDHFSESIKKQPVNVDSLLTKDELVVRVSYQPKGSKLRTHNFEVSIDYDQKKATNLVSSVHLAIDALGELFQTHIERPDEEFARVWTPMTVEKREFFYRYHEENAELESKADELLGIKKEPSLVSGEDFDQRMEDQLKEIEDIKNKLGLTED